MSTHFCVCYVALSLTIYPILSQTIQCLGKQSCKNTKLTCNTDKACTLICDGGIDGKACHGAELDASEATDVIVYCKNFQDCMSMDITCGNGDCNVECQSDSSCKQLNLICGTGDCQIECQTDTSCHKIEIDTTFPSSFHCINDIENCPSDIEQFVTTVSPNIQSTISTKDPETTIQSITSTHRTTRDINTIATFVSTIQSTSDFTIADDDFIINSFPEHTDTLNWMDLLYIASATVIVCFVVICCIYKAHKYCEKNANEGKTDANEHNDIGIMDINTGTDGDASPGVTTTLKPTTIGNYDGEGENDAIETLNCMETSVLIANEMSAMGVSCTVDGDGIETALSAHTTRSRAGTLERILYDIIDDDSQIIHGTVTPLFEPTLRASPMLHRTNILTHYQDTVGEMDDTSVQLFQYHPTLGLNDSATMDLANGDLSIAMKPPDIELNKSASLRSDIVNAHAHCRLKMVIYDFDETITRIHLYKELKGGGVDALKWISIARLIEIFGGWKRIQRLKKHFQILNTHCVQMGILSFGFEAVIVNVLSRMNLKHHFKFIVGRDSDGLKNVKGNKTQFIENLVLNAKYDKREILYIDDDPNNIESAVKRDCCTTLLIQERNGMNESHLQQIEAACTT